MARLVVKNGYQKDICYDEIGLCAQNRHYSRFRTLAQIPKTCHNELEIEVRDIWSKPELFWFGRHTRLCALQALPISVQDEVVRPIRHTFARLEEAAIANTCPRLDGIHCFLLRSESKKILCHFFQVFHQSWIYAVVDHLLPFPTFKQLISQSNFINLECSPTKPIVRRELDIHISVLPFACINVLF